jgi:hypothetical protein
MTRIIGNLDGTGTHYKVVGNDKIELSTEEKDVFMAASVEADNIKADTQYLFDRAAAYASSYSVGDQLDIIQRQIKAMADASELTLTDEATNWLNVIAQIKTNNPNPAE